MPPTPGHPRSLTAASATLSSKTPGAREVAAFATASAGNAVAGRERHKSWCFGGGCLPSPSWRRGRKANKAQRQQQLEWEQQQQHQYEAQQRKLLLQGLYSQQHHLPEDHQTPQTSSLIQNQQLTTKQQTQQQKLCSLLSLPAGVGATPGPSIGRGGSSSRETTAAACCALSGIGSEGSSAKCSRHRDDSSSSCSCYPNTPSRLETSPLCVVLGAAGIVAPQSPQASACTSSYSSSGYSGSSYSSSIHGRSSYGSSSRPCDSRPGSGSVTSQCGEADKAVLIQESGKPRENLRRAVAEAAGEKQHCAYSATAGAAAATLPRASAGSRPHDASKTAALPTLRLAAGGAQHLQQPPTVAGVAVAAASGASSALTRGAACAEAKDEADGPDLFRAALHYRAGCSSLALSPKEHKQQRQREEGQQQEQQQQEQRGEARQQQQRIRLPRQLQANPCSWKEFDVLSAAAARAPARPAAAAAIPSPTAVTVEETARQGAEASLLRHATSRSPSPTGSLAAEDSKSHMQHRQLQLQQLQQQRQQQRSLQQDALRQQQQQQRMRSEDSAPPALPLLGGGCGTTRRPLSFPPTAVAAAADSDGDSPESSRNRSNTGRSNSTVTSRVFACPVSSASSPERRPSAAPVGRAAAAGSPDFALGATASTAAAAAVDAFVTRLQVSADGQARQTPNVSLKQQQPKKTYSESPRMMQQLEQQPSLRGKLPSLPINESQSLQVPLRCQASKPQSSTPPTPPVATTVVAAAAAVQMAAAVADAAAVTAADSVGSTAEALVSSVTQRLSSLLTSGPASCTLRDARRQQLQSRRQQQQQRQRLTVPWVSESSNLSCTPLQQQQQAGQPVSHSVVQPMVAAQRRPEEEHQQLLRQQQLVQQQLVQRQRLQWSQQQQSHLPTFSKPLLASPTQLLYMVPQSPRGIMQERQQPQLQQPPLQQQPLQQPPIQQPQLQQPQLQQPQLQQPQVLLLQPGAAGTAYRQQQRAASPVLMQPRFTAPSRHQQLQLQRQQLQQLEQRQQQQESLLQQHKVGRLRTSFGVRLSAAAEAAATEAAGAAAAAAAAAAARPYRSQSCSELPPLEPSPPPIYQQQQQHQQQQGPTAVGRRSPAGQLAAEASRRALLLRKDSQSTLLPLCRASGRDDQQQQQKQQQQQQQRQQQQHQKQQQQSHQVEQQQQQKASCDVPTAATTAAAVAAFTAPTGADGLAAAAAAAAARAAKKQQSHAPAESPSEVPSGSTNVVSDSSSTRSSSRRSSLTPQLVKTSRRAAPLRLQQPTAAPQATAAQAAEAAATAAGRTPAAAERPPTPVRAERLRKHLEQLKERGELRKETFPAEEVAEIVGGARVETEGPFPVYVLDSEWSLGCTALDPEWPHKMLQNTKEGLKLHAEINRLLALAKEVQASTENTDKLDGKKEDSERGGSGS